MNNETQKISQSRIDIKQPLVHYMCNSHNYQVNGIFFEEAVGHRIPVEVVGFHVLKIDGARVPVLGIGCHCQQGF